MQQNLAPNNGFLKAGNLMLSFKRALDCHGNKNLALILLYGLCSSLFCLQLILYKIHQFTL